MMLAKRVGDKWALNGDVVTLRELDTLLRAYHAEIVAVRGGWVLVQRVHG